nr:RNA-directed DNA polymerase, eukaryota, reverse transcriptase zinc-binding domain protein [Tanacetum cinerariifolium]
EEDVHEEEREEVHKENDVDFTDSIFEDEVVVKDDVVIQKVRKNSNIDVVSTDAKDGAPTNSDPFGLEQLINKKRDGILEQHVAQLVESASFYKDLGDSHKPVSLSLLERLEETIKVGLALEIALWSSLANMITNWEGIFVAMGDFNEVREGSKMSKLDRFFILEDFYNYFPHINGVILEKGIPDHRPILLKEYVADFGPASFRFFHSWLDMDGFHNMVFETWNTECSFPKGCNSSFIALILKVANAMKNRRQLTIKGILNEGEWIENPDSIKNAFLDHFRKRFHQSCEPTPYFDVDMSNPITSDQRDFLERIFSRDKIKRAVWDCGGSFPKGCNSSFIALILKVANAMRDWGEEIDLGELEKMSRYEIGEKKLTWVIKAIHGHNGGIHVESIYSPIKGADFVCTGIPMKIPVIKNLDFVLFLWLLTIRLRFVISLWYRNVYSRTFGRNGYFRDNISGDRYRNVYSRTFG